MAKIKAPLFSLDATGTLYKNITYKGLKQNHIAQKYSHPGSKNPFESSPRQKDQRSIIRLITIHWQCMSAADKLSWENAAKDVRFKGTGYHYFLHMAQQNLTQYLGLVGYWSMNYNIDDKIPDLSGNGNDGTLGPIYPCDCPTLVDSFNKKYGKAAKFDGINDYINCVNTPSLQVGTSDFSLLMWVKVNSNIGGWAEGILIKYQSTDYRYGIDILGVSTGIDEGYIAFRLGKGLGNGLWTLQSTIKVNDNKWHFVASTVNRSGFAKLYIDGLFDTQLDISSTSGESQDNTGDLMIGRGKSLTLSGVVDDVTFTKSILSYEEIKKLFKGVS